MTNINLNKTNSVLSLAFIKSFKCHLFINLTLDRALFVVQLETVHWSIPWPSWVYFSTNIFTNEDSLISSLSPRQKLWSRIGLWGLKSVDWERVSPLHVGRLIIWAVLLLLLATVTITPDESVASRRSKMTVTVHSLLSYLLHHPAPP